MVSFIWTICYLSVLVGLSAYGDAPLFYYLPFSEESETRVQCRPARFEQLPVVTVQLPIFNESLRGREIAALGQQTGLSARSFANPGAGRFDRRHARDHGGLRGGTA